MHTHRVRRALLSLVVTAGVIRHAHAQAPVAPVALRATLAVRAPEIDGRMNDDVWQQATVIDGFRQFDPTEDAAPGMRTEARIAYDARNLYVFVRSFDPRPDSLVGMLSRRDVKTPSEQVKLIIDSYHDRRTGFEFAVNPVGVKRDYYLHDDVNEDDTWDGVWDVATRVDSLGWTAEYRIPLSQLRYPKVAEHTMGFLVLREVARTKERMSWPLLRLSKRGVASQLADVSGFVGLSTSRRAEIAPYTVARQSSRPAVNGFRGTTEGSAGADLKLGLGSALTLDATVNPDFGQVEADPAVLNLGAFETFFEERRPFFVEGNGIFGFGENSSRYFYSRRIGRAPQLAGLVDDPLATVPRASALQAAAKVSGHLTASTSLGVLAARTAHERVGGLTVEPGTTYGVARLLTEMRGGESSVGAMFTNVERSLDAPSMPYLRSGASLGGVDGRHRFSRGTYEVAGSIAASRVNGSAPALARTQRNAVHYFQRPDDGLAYDTTRTSLDGTSIEARAEKVAGAYRWRLDYLRNSAGFETNDVGFLERADWGYRHAEINWRSVKPAKHWRSASWFVGHWQEMSASGASRENTLESELRLELPSGIRFTGDLWGDNLYGGFCDRCTRGGPILKRSPDANFLFNLAADARARVLPQVAAIYTVADGGRSSLWRVRPYVTVNAASNIHWELGTRYQRNRDNTQWVTNVALSPTDTRYVFGRLDQHLLSFTARLDYTMTPALSLQLYAEPFVTTGQYDQLRELADGRASDYANRFRPTTALASAEGFNEKSFNSNAVLRWEYRPGSALFLVWQQGREQGDRDAGRFDAVHDYRNLFSARPDNVFLVKGSYWLAF